MIEEEKNIDKCVDSEGPENWFSQNSEEYSEDAIREILKEVHGSVEDIIEDFNGGSEESFVNEDNFEYDPVKGFISENKSSEEIYDSEKEDQNFGYSNYDSESSDDLESLGSFKDFVDNNSYGEVSWQADKKEKTIEIRDLLLEDPPELDDDFIFNSNLNVKHKDLFDY